MLLWPKSRMSVNVHDGSAVSYEPVSRFEPEDRSWVLTREMKHLAGKKRELFYFTKEGVCYAGTFRAGRVAEFAVDEYRSLAEKVGRVRDAAMS